MSRQGSQENVNNNNGGNQQNVVPQHNNNNQQHIVVPQHNNNNQQVAVVQEVDDAALLEDALRKPRQQLSKRHILILPLEVLMEKFKDIIEIIESNTDEWKIEAKEQFVAMLHLGLSVSAARGLETEILKGEFRADTQLIADTLERAEVSAFLRKLKMLQEVKKPSANYKEQTESIKLDKLQQEKAAKADMSAEITKNHVPLFNKVSGEGGTQGPTKVEEQVLKGEALARVHFCISMESFYTVFTNSNSTKVMELITKIRRGGFHTVEYEKYNVTVTRAQLRKANNQQLTEEEIKTTFNVFELGQVRENTARLYVFVLVQELGILLNKPKYQDASEDLILETYEILAEWWLKTITPETDLVTARSRFPSKMEGTQEAYKQLVLWWSRDPSLTRKQMFPDKESGFIRRREESGSPQKRIDLFHKIEREAFKKVPSTMTALLDDEKMNKAFFNPSEKEKCRICASDNNPNAKPHHYKFCLKKLPQGTDRSQVGRTLTQYARNRQAKGW